MTYICYIMQSHMLNLKLQRDFVGWRGKADNSSASEDEIKFLTTSWPNLR